MTLRDRSSIKVFCGSRGSCVKSDKLPPVSQLHRGHVFEKQSSGLALHSLSFMLNVRYSYGQRSVSEPTFHPYFCTFSESLHIQTNGAVPPVVVRGSVAVQPVDRDVLFKMPEPDHWITSLEHQIPQITCSFLWSHKRLYPHMQCSPRPVNTFYFIMHIIGGYNL